MARHLKSAAGLSLVATRTLSVVLLVAAACVQNEKSFHPALIDSAFFRALSPDSGGIASLDTLGPKEWTHLYVFGPYTTREFMSRCMALSGAFEDFGLYQRDDIMAFYFKHADGTVSSMGYPWGRVQIAQQGLGREYRRGTASFVARRDSSLGMVFWPVDTTSRSCPHGREPR